MIVWIPAVTAWMHARLPATSLTNWLTLCISACIVDGLSRSTRTLTCWLLLTGRRLALLLYSRLGSLSGREHNLFQAQVALLLRVCVCTIFNCSIASCCKAVCKSIIVQNQPKLKKAKLPVLWIRFLKTSLHMLLHKYCWKGASTDRTYAQARLLQTFFSSVNDGSPSQYTFITILHSDCTNT